MNFLEKDLEQVIYEAPDEFIFDNFEVEGKRFKQYKIGVYGISDLIFVNKVYSLDIDYINKKSKILDVGLEISIFELKKDEVNITTFLQAIRYAKGIQRFFQEREFYKFYIRILLCGKSVDLKSGFVFISDLFDNGEYSDIKVFNGQINKVELFSYDYKFDGLKIKNEHGYSFVNESFK